MSIKKTLHGLTHLFVFGVFVFLGSTLIIPQHEARATLSKRVFLTSGTTWTVPADFSSTNTVEIIARGGSGGTNSGGGGGAYAKKSNISLTPGASVSYQISSGDGVFDSTATTCAGSPTPSVCAKVGTAGVSSTNGAGGSSASSIGDVVYSGGPGGGGSGGGAAGPNGVGSTGTFDQGGTGDNGYGGAGGYAGVYEAEPPAFCASNGDDGYAGTEFSNLPAYGSGGGGGYGTVSCTSGTGGAYGGGGGGSGASAGGSGLIVITYTSTDTGSTSLAKFKIKGGSFLIRGGRVQIR